MFRLSKFWKNVSETSLALGPPSVRHTKNGSDTKPEEGKTNNGSFRQEGTIPRFQGRSVAGGEVTPKFQSSRGIPELLRASLGATS